MRPRLVDVAVAGACLLPAACGAPNPFRSHPAPFAGPDEVAVPYGSQDPEDVTGAVTSVNTSETDNLQDVLEMLRGHVPGLYVRETAGGDIRLQIRGSAQSLTSDGAPLLVIDDMPVGAGSVRLALKDLHPHDVKSIQVLKDVSTTAVYGTRGANGVILIYLKR